MKRATNFQHTGRLESVNALITKYALKNQYYGTPSMNARVAVTCLQNNENAMKNKRGESDGSVKLKVTKSRHQTPKIKMVYGK